MINNDTSVLVLECEAVVHPTKIVIDLIVALDVEDVVGERPFAV